MNNNEKKDRGIAIAGTIVVHALAVLILFLMAFKTPLPLPGEEGVEVDLGMMDQGMGNIQPEKPAIPQAAQPQQRLTRARKTSSRKTTMKPHRWKSPKTLSRNKRNLPKSLSLPSTKEHCSKVTTTHRQADRKASRDNLATKANLMAWLASDNMKAMVEKATELVMTSEVEGPSHCTAPAMISVKKESSLLTSG